jgi:hypothetical protein
MKKIIISLIIIFSGMLMFSPSVAAVNIFNNTCNSSTAQSTEVCKSVNSETSSKQNPFLKIMKIVINLMSYAIGIAAIIILIVAGLQMMIGGDDPQAVTNSRNMIIYALVGIVVAVLAQVIVVFVLKKVP